MDLLQRSHQVFLYEWDIRPIMTKHGTDWLEPFLVDLQRHCQVQKTPYILAPAGLPDALGSYSLKSKYDSNAYNRVLRELRQMYDAGNAVNQHYRTKMIPKADGKDRILHIPKHWLKVVQREIYDRFLKPQPISAYATAYKLGGKLVDNALPHLNARVVVKLDIRDFFGSITFSWVLNTAFSKEIVPLNVGVLLTRLCCLHGVLPQGAPTSPALSNIVMRGFDERVGTWCEEQAIAYTRYSDDMTFSGDFVPSDLIKKISAMVSSYGMRLNHRKTQVLHRSRRQMVTGIVVNHHPQVSRGYRRQIRQEVFYCKKFGFVDHLVYLQQKLQSQATKSVDAYIASLLGRIGHTLCINPQDREMQRYKREVLWMKRVGTSPPPEMQCECEQPDYYLTTIPSSNPSSKQKPRQNQ